MLGNQVVALHVRLLRSTRRKLTPCSRPSCGHTFCEECLTTWFNMTLGERRRCDAGGLPYACLTCIRPNTVFPDQNFSLQDAARAAVEYRGEPSPPVLSPPSGGPVHPG